MKSLDVARALGAKGMETFESVSGGQRRELTDARIGVVRRMGPSTSPGWIRPW